MRRQFTERRSRHDVVRVHEELLCRVLLLLRRFHRLFQLRAAPYPQVGDDVRDEARSYHRAVLVLYVAVRHEVGHIAVRRREKGEGGAEDEEVDAVGAEKAPSEGERRITGDFDVDIPAARIAL